MRPDVIREISDDTATRLKEELEARNAAYSPSSTGWSTIENSNFDIKPHKGHNFTLAPTFSEQQLVNVILDAVRVTNCNISQFKSCY